MSCNPTRRIQKAGKVHMLTALIEQMTNAKLGFHGDFWDQEGQIGLGLLELTTGMKSCVPSKCACICNQLDILEV